MALARGGNQKTRPAIIVNDDALGKLPLKVVVPLTDWKDTFEKAPWMITVEVTPTNGLTKTSSADCFQIRSVSSERFEKKLGAVSSELQERMKEGLKKVLSII
jgi:mRNA interferase MazF